MTFGEAIEAMKQGERVQRAGWNGKGMWVALTPGTVIPSSLARTWAAAHLAAERLTAERAAGDATVTPADLSLVINPHIDMRAADGSLVVGWLASQTDMLGEDWAVLPKCATARGVEGVDDAEE